jgi:hypothetical protein
MNYKVGDTVKYESWDGEEGRSYGWFLDTKKAKIVSVWYKLDNGDMVEEKKLVLVSPTQTQLKKDDPPLSAEEPVNNQ